MVVLHLRPSQDVWAEDSLQHTQLRMQREEGLLELLRTQAGCGFAPCLGLRMLLPCGWTQ